MTNKRSVELLGQKIAYTQEGEGEPVLFVHGITTYSFIWRKIVPHFAKRYSTVAIDLLGCGDSDKPLDKDYGISAQADILSSFIEELGLGAVHLVTHDIGGGIGQILAVRHPEQTLTLTLINSIGYDYWPVQPITSMRIPILREIGLAALDHGFLKFIVKRGVYHKDVVTDELLEYFQKPLKSRDGRRGFLRLAKSLDNRELTSIENDLRRIEIPTLIIRGDGDPYLSSEISRRLHKDISGSKLINIPSGGHFIQEDEPELLSKYIIDFIEPSTSKEMAYGKRKGAQRASA